MPHHGEGPHDHDHDHDHEHDHLADETSTFGDATEAPGGAGNRPAGPDYGESPLDDDTPGSQGEVDPGSEGDFGDPRVPAS